MRGTSPAAAIAIVEDEYIVALDIRNFLERSGYRVVGLFPSGDELLSRMEEAKPDLVLMDIKIRGSLDGVETASIVHERWATPVILLTAYADEETIARAKITQPFGYILKPFEERELRTAIEIALYRAAMERRLRESEERYRGLFDGGISGNFLADADGRIVEANPSFRRLLGLAADEALPRLDSLFSDLASWESFSTGLARSRRVELAEIALRSRGESEILALANAATVFDAKGASVGIQGELIDLTERRALEQRLAQSQKMEAIGRLAGGIAHDFNNILTAVLGYANLLGEESGRYPELKDDIEGIRKAAGKAAALTRQLLAFSRRQPVSPRDLDLGALVDDMEKMLRRLVTEDIALSLARDPATPRIFADPTQVEQVLVNLVVNAKDAMPEGGSLRVSTRGELLGSPRAVGVDTLPAGGYAVLEVRDSGHGIPPGILSKIFEPFFTTKPADRGTGLGLSTVYGIARQAGGAVGVSSAPGAGAVFSVYFPATRVRVQEESAPEETSPGAARPGTILFVDDDEALRNLVARLLERRGHRVLIAANAGEALLLAESHGSPIDLLVTDIVMPFMDGYRLARRLGEVLPGLRVLFASGYPEHSADPAAAGRFLAKPFTEADLALAVDRALQPESDCAAGNPPGS
ncbi:MAG: response regulator [Spirochaetaceae bacterium]|nr:response regulator [Spirochaetaceae bacterium]